MNLKGRDFLTLKDFSKEEIMYLIDLAAELKDKKKKGIPVDHHRGKNVALIFEKTSTRTRCSFEVAAHDLGMGTTYLDPSGSQIGRKESIADTARVLSRMYDGIEYRGLLWRSLQSIRTCLYGTDLPTSIILHRCLRTCLQSGSTLESLRVSTLHIWEMPATIWEIHL